MQPKISIVTATYNSERYLEEAIESVLAQGYDDLEHIIIDGASTDGTLDILGRYPHLRWISEPDSGMTEALNKGFRLATGEVVGWLNSDDYYLPGSLERVAAAATQHPDTDFFYGSHNLIREDGLLVRTVHNTPYHRGMLFFYGCYIPSTTSFWRRRLLERGFFLDESYQVAMDYEFFVRLAAHRARFRFIPATLASFRLRGDNVGKVKEAHWKPEEKRIWKTHAHAFSPLALPHRIKPLLAPAFKAKRVLGKLRSGVRP